MLHVRQESESASEASENHRNNFQIYYYLFCSVTFIDNQNDNVNQPNVEIPEHFQLFNNSIITSKTKR